MEKTRYLKLLKQVVEFAFKNDPRYAAYEQLLKEDKQRKYAQKKEEKVEKDRQYKEMQQTQRKIYEDKVEQDRADEKAKHEQDFKDRKAAEDAVRDEKFKNAKFVCKFCEIIFESNKHHFNHNNSDKHKKRMD